MAQLKVTVVGGGSAGLCAARYLQQDPERFECVVYEQAENIGGTWIYTDRVGTDEFGNRIHTSMYKSLRTNLPKESMQFPGLPFRECNESYIHWNKVLEYLNDYANKYNLSSCLQMNHRVDKISRQVNQWLVVSTDLRSNCIVKRTSDVVIVCNGHSSDPKFPIIEGMDSFMGDSIHSHDYRIPEPYAGKDVLLIGAGPSGLDLAYELSRVANKIFWSHHSTRLTNNEFPKNIYQKPDISRIDRNRIEFNDGTEEVIDAIIYCTGYNYTYQFLDDSCGITVEDNYISPLYKQIININQPTMSFIGVPRFTPQFPMFDLQVRFYISYLKNDFITKEEMLESLKEFEKGQIEKGARKDAYHALVQYCYGDYFDGMSEIANIEPVPDIMFKMHNHASNNIFSDFLHFRNNVYRHIDNEHFKFNNMVV